mmetsp:Transcript_66194/g.123575  ORF Transcript_66194/g.123575 Transcript_66194/m.123575 type:complete len:230 (-) Transcript_66194:103-792(-)
MSFGVYRPAMGVPGGHRQTSSGQSVQEHRRQCERMQRSENPITGGPAIAGGTGVPPRPPPSESFGSGLVPTAGPMDHITVPGRDVPAKRVDPTKNRAPAFAAEARRPSQDGPRNVSRITEGSLGELLTDRAPTPERRNTPGQVVRGGSRPKDQLLPGCLAGVSVQEHPMALPRKAGSGSSGVGTGGGGHLVAGPTGFVPRAMEDDVGWEPEVQCQDGSVPFRRVCGVGQ